MDVTGMWKKVSPVSLSQTASMGTGSLTSQLVILQDAQANLSVIWFWRNMRSQWDVRIGTGNLAVLNTILMMRFRKDISILVPEYSNQWMELLIKHSAASLRWVILSAGRSRLGRWIFLCPQNCCLRNKIQHLVLI